MEKLFYRIADLVKMMNVSKYTLYNWMAAGKFPKGVKLGPRAVGYPAPEIHHWLEERGISPKTMAGDPIPPTPHNPIK